MLSLRSRQQLPQSAVGQVLAVAFLALVSGCAGQTPVIGGVCKLDAPDVHIGGKQTQFFLRCESSADSAPGEGVWVVKSRNAGATPSRIPAAAIVKQEQQHQHKKMAPKTTSYVCDLVSDAHEHGYCSTSENCLQPVYTDRSAFLQCDSTTRRWSKKHCQTGFNFDFERQACIAHTAKSIGHFRQFPIPAHQSAQHSRNSSSGEQRVRGIVCTFAQCSPEASCNVGTCNNGYCCTPAVGALPTANLPSRAITNSSSSGGTTPVPTATSTTAPAEQQTPSGGSTSAAPPTPVIPSILVVALNDAASGGETALPGLGLQFDEFPANVLRAAAKTGASELLCSSGFRSPIRCSLPGWKCPPGLSCDIGPNLCCPLPPRQHAKRRRNTAAQQLHRRLGRRLSSWMPVPSFCTPCFPAQLLGDAFVADAFATDARPIGAFNPDVFCPNGAPAMSACAAPGYCAPPLQCMQGMCCPAAAVPALPPPPMAAYACPGGLPALGQCIGGRCAAPGTICASPANVCCAPAVVPAAIPATVCPDGTQAAGACVNGQCGAGFTCNQGLCCTNTSQTPRCLDGSQSVGACIQGFRCGVGYRCTTGNICCPSQINVCPPGQTSVGLAVNGRCPAGFTNVNGQCCGTQNAQSVITCPVEDSSGPCDSNSQCPEPGYACDVANNWCCPQVVGEPIGPCIQGEGGNRLCPEGYACTGEGEGQCYRLDTGTCPPEEQAGPCGPGDTCPQGYECIEGFCCQTDTGNNTRRRRRRHLPSTSAFLRLVRAT